jgi:predicted CoA-binding protein
MTAPTRVGAVLEDEDAIVAIARDMRVVAVVGIKDGSDPDQPAYTIPALLADSGVRIIGINPRLREELGPGTLDSVAELPADVDVVDVFRRAEAIPALADQLLALPAERRPAAVWLQTGIRHDEAARRLAAGGYRVVQDRCLGVYSRRARRPR